MIALYVISLPVWAHAYAAAVAADADNYLIIIVSNNAGQIHGGYVTLTG